MADDLATSIGHIKYLLKQEDYGDEDIANHLISFSLAKIITAMIQKGIIPETPDEGGPDARLRTALRNYQQAGTPSTLLGYLLITQRTGLNVFQIDPGTWFDALDWILFNYAGGRIDALDLYSSMEERPLTIHELRQGIIDKYPDSDILSDALEDTGSRQNPENLPWQPDPQYQQWLDAVSQLLEDAVGMRRDELPADYMWGDTYEAGFSPAGAINLLVGPLDDPEALREAIYIEGAGLGGIQRHYKMSNQEIADIALDALQRHAEDDEDLLK